MPSIRETILAALYTTLQTIPGALIQRGEVLPERVVPNETVTSPVLNRYA